MSSKSKFISVLVIILLTLLLCVGLVILNYDDLKESNNIDDIEYVEVPVDDDTEEDIVITDGEKINMYLFWGDGCVHCHNLKIFLNDLDQKYKNMFELYTFEVWGNTENQSLMNRFAEKLEDNPKGVPYLVVGKETFNGFSSSMEDDIIQAIIDEYKSDEQYDVYEELSK